MKLVGSGFIWRLFAGADEHTILRRPNIHRFVIENGVPYQITQSVWLMDLKIFMKTIAPKEFPENLSMPRLRCIKTAVKEYNGRHRKKKIDRHDVEKCMRSGKVFKYYHGNRWIINYDELEPVIDAYLEK